MRFARVFDYIRPNLAGRGGIAAGVAMLAVGLAVVAGVALYYGFGRYGASQLDDLNASAQGPVELPASDSGQPQIRGALMPDGSFKPIQIVSAGASDDSLPVANAPAPVRATYAPDPEPAASEPSDVSPSDAPSDAAASTASASAATPTSEPAVANADAPNSQPPTNDSQLTTNDSKRPIASVAKADGRDLLYAYNAIYPGYRIHPKHWDRPWEAGADDYAYGVVKHPDGYVSVSSTQGADRGNAPVASQIIIPSINVDSAVETLAIIDIGDSREYETPKHVVGRIPNTSNPGELGNGWLFGHLESPIRGEGNVFQRLPEIPALLSAGDPVYVSLLNEDGDEYLYQVTATKVVHEDEIALYDTEDATITLVACVPRLVYDHRLLVSAELVGVKKAA